jgi:hypothetical protein
MPAKKPGLLFLPEGAKVRTTPEGCVSVIDILATVGAKDPHSSYRHLCKSHQEVPQLVRNFKFPGPGQKETPVVDREGFTRLMLVIPGPRGAKFREGAAKLILRYLDGDITLAAEIADRQEDPEKLRWLENRVRAKRTNKELNGAIHGAGALCYREVARLNSRGATGLYPAELRAKRGVKATRDGYTTAELAAVAHAEALEAEAIEARRVQGDSQVLSVAAEFSGEIERLRRQARGALPAKTAPALPAPSEAPLAPSAPPDIAVGRVVLATLAAVGLKTRREGATLWIGPNSLLSASLRALIAQHKTALLAALDAEAAEGTTL